MLEVLSTPQYLGAIAYDQPISGKVYMLVYHQGINFPRLKNHLMRPMKSRMAGVRINELPMFFCGGSR